MIFLYNMFMSAAYALVYPWGRMKASAGREIWRGRLGLISQIGPKDLWLHAASVGEVKVLGYLIDYLQKRNPSVTIHASVTTPAGFKTAVSIFGQDITVTYFPVDSRAAVRKTLKRIEPRIIVIAETEIWPCLITEATSRNIPIALINGRMSAGAFRKYRMIKASFGRLLANYDRFFFKTSEDRDRYSYFGVDGKRCEVAGDMKFDAPLLEKSASKIREARRRAGVSDDAFFLTAGSTRPGEEEILIEVYLSLKKEHERLRLLLAPRHLDRLEEVKRLLEARGLGYAIYGDETGAGTRQGDAIILVDRMGMLNDLYLAADMAFVGGTLVDIGGHNILEPVWAQTPVVFGPYLDNVKEAAEHILEQNYGVKVNSAEELRGVLAAAMTGARTFNTKTGLEQAESPTARVGNYLLQRLSDD